MSWYVSLSVLMVREGDGKHQLLHLRHLRLHTAAVGVVARAQKACGVLGACADQRVPE
jgi:hypothetical protein